MKEILGEHLEQVKTDILAYISSKSEQLKDRSLLKAIKLQSIVTLDETKVTNNTKQLFTLKTKIENSNEDYAIKIMMSVLVDLLDEDYHSAAYTLNNIDYSLTDNGMSDKLDMLRRLAKLIYFDDEAEIIPALESLMKVLPRDIKTSSILWFFYHMDSEAAQPKKLIIMCNTILNILPDDYHSHFFKAFLYSESEQYTEAIESYKTCVSVCQKNDELKGDIGWICMRLASCYLSLNDLPSVIDTASLGLKKYQEVIDIDGYEKIFYPAIYSLRSKAFLLQEKYDLALLDSDSALKYSPDDEYLLDLKKRILKHC